MYLNDRPPGCSGGELRCYDGLGGFSDVVPAAGRIVVFRSRELKHEVRPVVGWRRMAASVWILKDRRGEAEQ